MKSSKLSGTVILYLLTSWFRIALLCVCGLVASNISGSAVVRMATFLALMVPLNAIVSRLRKYLHREQCRLAQHGEHGTL